MLHVYCPEMGENEPKINVIKQVGHLKVIKQEPIKITARIGHYGGWYVNTKEHLKGRGIKFIDEFKDIKRYKLTDLAFKKLENQYEIKMESLLD